MVAGFDVFSQTIVRHTLLYYIVSLQDFDQYRLYHYMSFSWRAVSCQHYFLCLFWNRVTRRWQYISCSLCCLDGHVVAVVVNVLGQRRRNVNLPSMLKAQSQCMMNHSTRSHYVQLSHTWCCNYVLIERWQSRTCFFNHQCFVFNDFAFIMQFKYK